MNKYLIFFYGTIHNKARLVTWKDVPMLLVNYAAKQGGDFSTPGWGVLDTVTVWQLPAGDNTILKRVPLGPLRAWIAGGDHNERFPEPTLP